MDNLVKIKSRAVRDAGLIFEAGKWRRSHRLIYAYDPVGR